MAVKFAGHQMKLPTWCSIDGHHQDHDLYPGIPTLSFTSHDCTSSVTGLGFLSGHWGASGVGAAGRPNRGPDAPCVATYMWLEVVVNVAE